MMKKWIFGMFGCLLALGMVHTASAEMREWTDATGARLEAEYMSSTDKAVTLRKANLQNLIVPLEQLSEADREFVAELQKKEAEENIIEIPIKGEIVWRLSGWRSLGWSTTHAAEIWSWDAEGKKPKAKITDVKVNYILEYATRNEFKGQFETEGKVKINKTERLVILSTFDFTTNGERKQVKDTSIPMELPQVTDNMIKLPTVRASAR